MWFRRTVAPGLTSFLLAIALVGKAALGSAPEDARFVPQLELTNLEPNKVAFAPDNGALLMVVNAYGRIDLFDITDPNRPAKITEIAAAANDAAFTPKGTPRYKVRIVSGGGDGALRLWTLDGKPASEPFKGHAGKVTSVAFSPDGARIASGGRDGAIRLWAIDGKPATEPLKGHEGAVNSLAFSPDGTRIASGGWDGTIRLWALDGKPLAEPFKAHEGGVRSVAFSPDGTRIVSGGNDGTVRLWTQDGRPAAEPFKGHSSPMPGLLTGSVSSVAFLPNGTHIVSGGSDGTIRLWTLDGKPAAEPVKSENGWVSSIAVAPDGTHIVYGGLGIVRLEALNRRADGEVSMAHDDSVWSVSFSPDGRHIASGSKDGTVRLWELDGTPAAAPFRGHNGGVASVAFSPDGGRIVSGGEDGTIRLWALDGTPAAAPFSGHVGKVWSVAFAPDGTRIVSGGDDGTIRLWALDGDHLAEPFKGHDGAVNSVAFSPDGTRIVSGGDDGTIRLWQLDGKPAVESFRGHAGEVLSVAFSPDGTRIVSAGEDATVRLWTLDGRQTGAPFKGHDGRVLTVAFSPDGTRIASGGEDDTVRLWTLDGKEAAEPFYGHDDWVESVVFSPDGTHVVSGGDDSIIQVWAVQRPVTLSAQPVGEPIKGRANEFESVVFSHDGTHIATGGRDGHVRLWAVDGQPSIESSEAHIGVVESVAFSPDSTRIVSAGDAVVRLWTLDGRQAAEPFRGHAEFVWQVAFSPDGRLIASGEDDGTVRLWGLDGSLAAPPFKGHSGSVWSVAFSPAGTRIASGGSDGTVRLWTLDGKPAAAPFRGHEGRVLRVVFSPDGSRLVSSGWDGTIRLWMLDGSPAAPPFKGHDGPVRKVVFSPDGRRIISGGDDGTVRVWNIASGSHSILPLCRAQTGLGFVDDRLFWVGCHDRIIVLSASFKPRGELFLHKLGLVALVYGEGIYLTSDQTGDSFRKISADGAVDMQRHAIPEVSAERVREVLLDEWTFPERIYDFIRRGYAGARAGYEWLGWWKVPFWPALGWLTAIFFSLAVWLFAPDKLSRWAMHRVGSPEIPAWKWLAGILALFGYLGTTRRSLRAWLRKYRDELYEHNFSGRTPVKEREKYCNLGHEAEIAAFAQVLSAGRSARLWISGVGGGGKSALAFRMLRVATEGNAAAPLPILVDEDWSGRLVDQVVELLRVDDRIPTPKMVEILGSRGALCLLIDSLSERGMADALDRVADEVGRGRFASIVVTSRQPPPGGHVWHTFKPIVALPLAPAQIPDYVATYAEPERRTAVSQQIAPLITASRSVSPLFVRFAIEQALAGQVSSTSTVDLVLRYVEALRAGRLDLNADDMLRAASIAATEAVRESLVPREIEQAYLRGVLVKEADALRFMNARNTAAVDPAAIIEMLVDCGLLNRNVTNRRLQFAYDPVAEHLAARLAAQGALGVGVAPLTLKERILSEPTSAIARLMAEIGGALRPQPRAAQPAGAAVPI